MQKNIKKSWEKEFDRGTNKILKENELPATASFLIVFSKSFICTLLKEEKKKWEEEIYKNLPIGQELTAKDFVNAFKKLKE